MNLLNVLLKLPKNSIYGLVNETKKEVYLTYATDQLGSLLRLLGDYRNGSGFTNDISQFEYKLFEEVTDKKELKLRYNHWYDQLNVKGYKLLNKRRAISYKLIATIEKKLLYVKLRSRYSEIVVGVFDDILDCQSFMDNYGDLYNIKYSSNLLTKEYLNG